MTEIASLFARIGADVSDFDKKMGGVKRELGGLKGAFGGLQKAVGLGVVAAAGAGVAAVSAIAGIAASGTRAAADFESAFTGVIKTVDATDAELAMLRESIIDMTQEIPLAATEIAGIAEAAGQLGIKTENILGFTRVMADLGVTTNMSSDEAATALARFANITGMSQTEFDRLGSSIVALGNNLATTEGEIVEMGLRIAGAGAQVGMTEAQIMGMAGALSSVGINAEAGGTAISRVMIDMASSVANGGKELDQFASVAGMSSAEFTTAFKQDAASAILTFIEGLDGISRSGGNVFGVLDDLGLGEIRVRDALLRAAGAGDLFRDSLELGSAAWQENNALTKEAALRYGTTASEFQLFWNAIDAVRIEIGDKLLPLLGDFLNWGTEFVKKVGPHVVEWFGHMADTATVLLGWLGEVVTTGEMFGAAFLALPQPLQDVITVINGIITAVRNFIAPIAEAVASVVKWQDILTVIGGVILSIVVPAIAGFIAAAAPVVGIFVALVAAAAALRLAWETDFGGIRTFVTEALTFIGDAFGPLLTTIQTFGGQALQEIWAWVTGNESSFEAVGKIWDAVKETARMLFEGLISFITTTLPKWGKKLMEWGAAAWEWIKEAVPLALEWIGKMGSALIAWLAAKLPDWLAAIYEWGAGIVDWIADAIPSAIRNLTAFVRSLREEGGGPGLQGFLKMAGDWANALWRWIVDDLIPAVGPAFLKYIGALMNLGGQLLLALGGLVVELGLLLWEWIVDITPDAVKKLGEWGEALWEWIVDNTPTWVKKLSEWATAAWEWIVKASGPALEKLKEWGGKLWKWLADNMPTWVANLAKWGVAAWKWIVDVAIPKVREKMGEWGAAIQAWLAGKVSEFVGKFKDFGRNIIQGLRDGITEKWNDLTNWFGGVWGNLTDRFKRFFGIHSPSTLFRTYGADMMAGLRNGIDAGSGQVFESVDAMRDGIAGRLETIDGLVDKTKAGLTKEAWAAQLKLLEELSKPIIPDWAKPGYTPPASTMPPVLADPNAGTGGIVTVIPKTPTYNATHGASARLEKKMRDVADAGILDMLRSYAAKAGEFIKSLGQLQGSSEVHFALERIAGQALEGAKLGMISGDVQRIVAEVQRRDAFDDTTDPQMERNNELLTILIQELRNKNMSTTVNVTGAGGNYSDLVQFTAAGAH